MSGHSKWANIKHRKAKGDALKGNLFSKMSKEIIVAARQGGGNPDANTRLRIAIQKARDANVPWENIQRAIKRGTGELEGAVYEEITYEGYGPGGVAVMVDVMTDNRNRTASDIRYIFSKNGGNLGETGSVAWLFKKKGYITVDKAPNLSEDDLLMAALDGGAEDMSSDDKDVFEITTAPEDLYKVKEHLEKLGIKTSSAEVTMIPQTTVKLSGHQAEQMMRLYEALEEHDDVQKVYANFDIDEEEMEKLIK